MITIEPMEKAPTLYLVKCDGRVLAENADEKQAITAVTLEMYSVARSRTIKKGAVFCKPGMCRSWDREHGRCSALTRDFCRLDGKCKFFAPKEKKE